MNAAQIVALIVVVGGSALCALPGVSPRLPLGFGGLTITSSILSALLGLDAMSVALAELAYYCLGIAVISSALSWTGMRFFAAAGRRGGVASTGDRTS